MKLLFAKSREQVNYYKSWHPEEDIYPVLDLDVISAVRLLEMHGHKEWPIEDIVVLPGAKASKPVLKRLLGSQDIESLFPEP